MPRPPVQPVDRLRTQVWLSNLMAFARAWTPHALEKVLEPDKVVRTKEENSRGGKWHRYARGSVTPSSTLLSDLERRFPGSRGCWDSIIWRIFKGEALPARALMDGLFSIGIRAGLHRRNLTGPLTLYYVKDFYIPYVENVISFHAFEMLIVLVQYMDEIREIEFSEHLANTYRLRRREFVECDTIRKFYPALFDCADRVCNPTWTTSRGEKVMIEVPWYAEFQELSAIEVHFRLQDSWVQEVKIVDLIDRNAPPRSLAGNCHLERRSAMLAQWGRQKDALES